MCDEKRLELWHNHNWLFHHDNTPAHTSLKTTEYRFPSSLLARLSPLGFSFVFQIESETEQTTFWNSV
jgi:hypothetical protein